MEEYEYIKEHYDFNSFVVKYKVKLDDGTYFFEEIDDSIGTKRKNTKKETIFLKYFTKKYLNKSIHNYLIYNIRFDKHFFYDDTRQLYFDCKCNKCGRVICQTAHNFLLEPIICKCSDEKYKFRAEMDYEWDRGLIPYKKRIFRGDSYYDISMDDLFNMYFENNNVIYRMGFSSIKNYNIAEAYFTGSVSIPLEGKYINFENVYYNYYSDMSDEKDDMYPMSFRHKYVYNPILFFYDGEKYYDFKTLTKESLLVSKNYDSFVFIYFEKKKDNYIMNVYNNDNLIFSKNIFVPYIEIFTIKNNDINTFSKIKDFNIDDENVTDYIFRLYNDGYYRFNIEEKKIKSFDLYSEKTKFELQERLEKTKIAVNINFEYLDNNLRNYIKSFNKVDNTKYKRIYVHKNAYEKGWILYEYLKDKAEVNILENEFSDDKSINYCFLIEREKREILDFVDYVILHSSDQSSYEYNIYEHPISTICIKLLKKKENADKIINAIRKEKILEFETKEKENYIIDKIERLSTIVYKFDYSVIPPSYYEEIIIELKNKYQVDDFGLFLILLIKYGEDIAFGLNERNHDTKQNKEKFEKLYDELMIRSNYKTIKWYSEYNLYLLIKTYFNDAIFQYKFEELGEQRIDIFVPSLNIAFEYQGEQHYVSGIFGDEVDFEHSKWLDERKRKICKANNIHLIEWHFETIINKIELDYVLWEYKELLYGKYEFSDVFFRKRNML